MAMAEEPEKLHTEGHKEQEDNEKKKKEKEIHIEISMAKAEELHIRISMAMAEEPEKLHTAEDKEQEENGKNKKEKEIHIQISRATAEEPEKLHTEDNEQEEEEIHTQISTAMAEGPEKLHTEDKEQEENANRVKSIQEITGYKFRDPILLQQAFTHPSYAEVCSSSFDLLSYQGDTVLQFLITEEHCALYRNLDKGKLTRLRSVNVDTEKLARVALKYGLHKFLRHNILSLEEEIDAFKEAIKDYPLHSNGLIDVPKVLADISESLIGAIHIDCNSSADTTWKIAKNLLEPMITPETLIVHPVTQLQEMCQKKGLAVKTVDLWKETGEFEYVIAEKFVGRAKYTGKRNVAKNKAALDAYYQVVQELDS